MGRWRRGQHRRVAQSDDLPGTVAIDDFERRQSAGAGIDAPLLRLVDDAVMPSSAISMMSSLGS
jgi:hypothetical protein